MPAALRLVAVGIALTNALQPQRGNSLTRSSSLCLDGRAVPQVYLLGQMKCGTTTLAEELGRSGLESPVPQMKELHLFDEMCGFTGIRETRTCDAATESDISGWLDNFDRCADSSTDHAGPVLADMTPINLRLPGLPTLLQRIYSESTAQKLTFVIALIDPLTRLASHFYHLKLSGKISDGETLHQWADRIIDKADDIRFHTKAGDIASVASLDVYYRSLYAMNFEPWLRTFRPDQFFIVPMRTYFESSLDSRRDSIDNFAKKFNLPLNASNLQYPRYANTNDHAKASDALTPDQQAWFSDRFKQDSAHLAEMLADTIPHGLVVSGYKGPADASKVLEYLSENW